jgi:hypothetical protein
MPRQNKIPDNKSCLTETLYKSQTVVTVLFVELDRGASSKCARDLTVRVDDGIDRRQFSPVPLQQIALEAELRVLVAGGLAPFRSSPQIENPARAPTPHAKPFRAASRCAASC